MSIKVAGGSQENGIVIGNTYDKYNSKNPIVKWMMNGFHNALSDLVAKAEPLDIHEIGCGEGYWVTRWNNEGLHAKGCDFSSMVIEMAKENAKSKGISTELFSTKNIYNLDPLVDSADLIVCCEVLEHLDNPKAGLEALQRVTKNHLILSVPREPLWCALNMARGKYIAQKGNTPGHVQNWSKTSFINLVSEYFEIIEVKSPLPWTMLLCRPL